MADEKKRREQDAFWDISKLVPQKRATLSRFSQPPSPVSVEIPKTVVAPPVPTPPEGERALTVPREESRTDEVVSYRPEGNPLLCRVTVRRAPRGYSFFEQFRKDAHRYFGEVGAPADYTPFFSFTPQYSQLSPAQRAYYFYLRSEIRAGRYPKADKGYFFLFVYEIIHLHDLIPPEDGARLLATLWENYRDHIAGLDRYMITWLADYCLYHGIACPDTLSGGCLSAVAASDEIEFYFGNAAEATEDGILRFLALSSDYRFEASRALTEENKPLFVKHVTGGMARVLPLLFADGLLGRSERAEVFRRRAFSGSLCSHNLRAEIEVEYISLRRSEALRRTVGLSVKYIENCLRAAFGIRARLSVSGLPDNVKTVIDRYFSGVREALSPQKPPAPVPAYERLYDAPEVGIDRCSAGDIEAASWALTRRLVPEDEIEVFDPAPVVIPTPEPPSASADTDALYALVEAFLSGGNAPEAAAMAAGIPLPLAAERVNEEFLALIGDVLLLPSDHGFTLIDDYREDAEEWLKTHKK